MIGIGLSASLVFMAGTDKYDTTGYLGALACVIAMCIIFMLGYETKEKICRSRSFISR